jgi:hypothetical protein
MDKWATGASIDGDPSRGGVDDSEHEHTYDMLFCVEKQTNTYNYMLRCDVYNFDSF